MSKGSFASSLFKPARKAINLTLALVIALAGSHLSSQAAYAANECQTGFTYVSATQKCFKVFTASGTFTPTTTIAGVEYLLVGGGAGGLKIGTLNADQGIAGDPGVVSSGSIAGPLTSATTLTITIGAGGAGAPSTGNPTAGGTSTVSGGSISLSAAGGSTAGRATAAYAGTSSSITGSAIAYGAAGPDGTPTYSATANRGIGGGGAKRIYHTNECYGTGAGWSGRSANNWYGAIYVTNVYGAGCDSGSGNRYDYYDYGSANGVAGSGSSGVFVLSYLSVGVSSFTYGGAQAITNAADPYDFDITFNQAMTDASITASDFNNTGTATGCTFSVAGASPTYTVSATGCSDGTVIPSFAAGAATAATGGTGPGSAFIATTSVTVDRTAPNAPTSPTFAATGGTVTALTLNGSNTGFTAGATITAGQATGGRAEFYLGGVLIGTDSTILVGDTSVSLSASLPQTGAIQAALAAGGAFNVRIYDAAGNYSTSTSLTINSDLTAPTVIGFDISNGQSLNTAALPLSYTLTLSEAVLGLTASDFSNTGTATGCVFTPTVNPLNSLEYSVSVSGCSAGSITPRLSAASINDSASNSGPATATAAASTVNFVSGVPTNTAAPALSAVSGSLTTLGSMLATTNGTWNLAGDSSATYTTKWQVCTTSSAGSCTDILGATSGTYSIPAGMLGQYIRSTVSSTNLAGISSVIGSTIYGPLTKGSQTLTWTNVNASSTTYSPTPISLAATSSSALAATYSSSTPVVCSVSGSSVTMLGAGTCTVAANQAGDPMFNAATAITQSFTITRATGVISIVPPSSTAVAPNSNTTIAISGYLGTSPVTYTVVSGGSNCVITNGVFTPTGPADCVITASVAQDAAYTAATSSQLTFTVRNPQTLTFAQPRGYGLAEGSATFAPTSSASLTVAFASSTTSVCTLSGFVATFVATGTCTLTASQAGDSTYAAATSVIRSFSVSNAASPATINNVSPSANHASGASITVDFTAGTANGATINGYTIRLNPQPSGTPIDVPCAASPCSVSGLTPSADYTVEVITNSTIGGQSFTSISNSQPVSTPVVPAFFEVVPGEGPNWSKSKNFNLDTTYNGKISWTSQTSSVCTVDGKGAVTAVSPGTCAILVQTTDATGAAGYSVLQMFTIPASVFRQDDPSTTPIVCGVNCPGPIKYEPVQRKTITGFTASGAPILLGAKSGPTLQFGPDSAMLTSATKALLDQFVSANTGKAGKVFATGFVMRAGKPKVAEVKLANARAAAVAKYLQSKGIDCGIDYFGYGARVAGATKGKPTDRKVVLRWDAKK